MSSLTSPALPLPGENISGVDDSDFFKTYFREAMKKLPEEEKVKIQAQVEEFRTEQMKFDREVIKFSLLLGPFSHSQFQGKQVGR